jgi:hypothetical protein
MTLRRPPGEPVVASTLKLRAERPNVLFLLEQIIRRCLATKPEDRFPDASALARALDGCRSLALARERLPFMEPVSRTLRRMPRFAILWLFASCFAPHLVGSVFLPAYNQLTLPPPPEQDSPFGLHPCTWIALRYGGIVYPVVILIAARLYASPALVWWRLMSNRPVFAEQVDLARRQLSRAPMGAVGLSVLGWLPLLAYIPISADSIGVRLGSGHIFHVAASVLISLLIAATYTWYILQYAIVRFAYPEMWCDASSYLENARHDLAPIVRRVPWFQVAAILVPLAGASLFLILVGEVESHSLLRALLLFLIVLGMAGVGASVHYGGKISQTIDALTLPGEPNESYWRQTSL